MPTSTDVACIGVGKTVTISEGAQHAGAVEVEGSLSMLGGSLELASGLEVSKAALLTLEHATLTGVGTLDVTGTLDWEEGSMSGSGKTVVESGASASIAAGRYGKCEGAALVARTFVNDGTVTLGSNSAGEGSLAMSEGARLENAGVFYDNADGYSCSPTWSTIVESAGSKAAPLILNTGTFEETEGSGPIKTIEVPFENDGTFYGKAGGLGFAKAPVTLASGSVLDGSIGASEATVTAGSVLGAGATLTLTKSTLTIASGDTATIDGLSFEEATVTGAGTLDILSSLLWEKEGILAGKGKTVLEGVGTGGILEGVAWCEGAKITERTLVNDGTITFSQHSAGSSMRLSDGARIDNNGTFVDNSTGYTCGEPIWHAILGGRTNKIVNTGKFERTNNVGDGEFPSYVDVPFENWGRTAGELAFTHEVGSGSDAWGCSEENPSFPKREVASEAGVCTGSGDLSESQTDFAIGGRGVGLNLTRTYNSQAAEEGKKGVFGYGWTSPYSEHLTFETLEAFEGEPERHIVQLIQENGSTVEFTEGTGSEWKAPEGSPDILTGSTGAGFTLTLEGRDVYKFAGSSGRLESIADANGNTTTLTYNGSGQLEKVTDPASRTLKFTYNGEGLVKTATDPMEHVIEYTYDAGNLVGVTQPGEAALRWKFKYEGKSQLVESVDGRGKATTYKYSGAHRVTSKTDPMGRTTAYEYGTTFAKITNEATKAVTVEYLASSGQLVEAVHGSGTSNATTEAFTYDTAGDTLSETNGNGYTTRYEYDSAGNRILREDPEGHKTKWTYNSEHEIETETTPDGETTTYKRDTHGNVLAEERPAPGGATQSTTYKYNEHGGTESMTNPVGKTWKYEYDSEGDRTTEIDPEGDKRTWEYNKDSQKTETVSPEGHVTGAKESKFTTTTERDARGLPTKIVAPLKHETKEEYDSDGNLIEKTDPEGNITKYVYNADDELEETIEPNKDSSRTEYDGAGQVLKQTNGDKQSTTYKRNVIEQVEEITDPLGRKTYKEYDGAGNVISETDAEKRTTTYKYDPDSRVVEVIYSDGKTPTVEYEYNGDGDRTKMTDGSGTTTYEYDELDRPTEAKDGHGDIIDYEYNLDNQPTKITYPNGKAVTRTYDNAGRLKTVTDWLEHTTKFTYDADSNLTTTAYPAGTSDEDTYHYNEADAMSEIKMIKGSETLASIVYTRNKDEGVTKATTAGLPGEEKLAFSYDEDNRLTKGAGVTYKYDEANNPTTIGSDTYSYNAADDLEKATEKKTTEATYSYNEVGERTKTEPTSGPATTYGYNQAADLTSVTRPKGTEVPAIEDTYAYNGDGLLISQTISSTTTYVAWDTAEHLPVILNDGTNSYIYGPGDLPVEQISSAGAVVYLHHDQQGSTRLLTNAAGENVGSTTYDAYGKVLGRKGTSTSPLGYDGQYTESDTGLIYLRARYYDPSTAQFLSVDPAVVLTLSPYTYAGDDPVDRGDPLGEFETNEAESQFGHEYLRELGRIEKKLAKRESKAREIYHEILEFGFLKGLLERTSDEELIRTRTKSLEQLQARLYRKIYGAVSRLDDLQFDDSPESAIKTLFEVAWNLSSP